MSLRTAFVAALLLLPAIASARTRAARRIEPAQPVPSVSRIAHDARGFVWLGTSGGLMRYDGHELVRWRPDVIARVTERLVVASDDTLYLSEQAGGLYRVRGNDVEELLDPDGQPFFRVRDIAVDARGHLWVVAAGRVLSTEDGRTWREPLAGRLEEDPRALLSMPDGSIVLATRWAVWRIDHGGAATRLLALSKPKWLAHTADGALWVSTWEDGLWRWHGGVLDRVLEKSPLHIAALGDTLWATDIDGLIRISGRDTEPMRVADGIPLGRTLGVDGEGGLWLGSSSGLFHFPAVETAAWTPADGMPAPLGRFLARTAEGLWVVTWSGMARIDADGTVDIAPAPVVRDQPCTDGEGALWAMPERGFLTRRAGVYRRHERDVGGEGRCARNPVDGTVWLVRLGKLFRSRPGGELDEGIDTPHARDPYGGPNPVFHDRAGRLWVASRNRVCHTAAATPGHWTCAAVDVGRGAVIEDIRETHEGALWMAVLGEGVFRWDGEAWRLMPSSRELPSRWMLMMRPSPRGGAWILGKDFAVRAIPDGEDLRVVERLGWRHGMASPGASDVLEDADGRLWLAGQHNTVIEIPPEVRFDGPPPPTVVAVRTSANGRALPASASGTLAASTERVEVTFRALTYREPGRVRYRVRVNGGAWSAPRPDASFTVLDPGPGRYEIEATASLDGKAWSAEPARVTFAVATPWYRQWWALALATGIALALVYLAHRARVAVHVRMERQRLRIAMDLHDDVGSGLGSIGVLAGVAAGAAAPPRAIAEQIAATASELGDVLGDIVWTLRDGSGTLTALMANLARRGETLLAASGTRLVVAAPAPMPEVTLSLPVLRNLQRIGLEALHNAARHARAARVELSLTRRRGRWTLVVEDDGRGLGDVRGDGLGLASMRRRAAEIGATFEIGAGADRRGVRVAVTFDPRADDRRVRARRR